MAQAMISTMCSDSIMKMAQPKRKCRSPQMRTSGLQAQLAALEVDQDFMQADAVKDDQQHQDHGADAERGRRLELVRNLLQ